MLYNMWHHYIITSLTWSHIQLPDSRGYSHHTTRSPRLCYLVFKLKSVISALVEHSLFAPNPPKRTHCMKYMIQRRTRPKLKKVTPVTRSRQQQNFSIFGTCSKVFSVRSMSSFVWNSPTQLDKAPRPSISNVIKPAREARGPEGPARWER